MFALLFWRIMLFVLQGCKRHCDVEMVYCCNISNANRCLLSLYFFCQSFCSEETAGKGDDYTFNNQRNCRCLVVREYTLECFSIYGCFEMFNCTITTAVTKIVSTRCLQQDVVISVA